MLLLQTAAARSTVSRVPPLCMRIIRMPRKPMPEEGNHAMTDDERRELLEACDYCDRYGDRFGCRLASFVRATLAAPQWTSELPTVVGWYWTRYKSGSKPYPLEVEHGDSGLIAGESGVLASEIKCEWAGPITPPGDKP